MDLDERRRRSRRERDPLADLRAWWPGAFPGEQEAIRAELSRLTGMQAPPPPAPPWPAPRRPAAGEAERCPWCEGAELLTEAVDVHGNAWSVGCSCGAAGPPGDSPGDALRRWNAQRWKAKR